jgi:heat shock protein HslJ
MNRSIPLFVLGLAALTTASGCMTRQATRAVADASAVGLVDTQWRLSELGGQVLINPEGTNTVGMQLQAQNSRVVGYSGCNRMFGNFVLEGDTLKFAQMGGTRMACTEAERMQLEQRYLDMFSSVARWKIIGNSLQLLGTTGAPLATFVAMPATG